MSDDDDGSTVIIFKIRTNDNNAYGRLFRFICCCVFFFFLLLLLLLSLAESGMKNNEWDSDMYGAVYIEDCDETQRSTVNLGFNG